MPLTLLASSRFLETARRLADHLSGIDRAEFLEYVSLLVNRGNEQSDKIEELEDKVRDLESENSGLGHDIDELEKKNNELEDNCTALKRRRKEDCEDGQGQGEAQEKAGEGGEA